MKFGENNMFCLKRKGFTACFPKKDTNSLCNQGVSFPEEQYRDCIRYSEICDEPGTFPVPRVPSRYYTCSLNEEKGRFIKEIKVCEQGKIYDPRSLTCLTPEEMIISKTIPTTKVDYPPTCTKIDAVPDEHNCKSFYMCSGIASEPVKLYCALRTYFSEKHGTCTDFMTSSCMKKFHDSEKAERDRALRHFWAVKEIWESEREENFEDETTSVPPLLVAESSDDGIMESEDPDYEDDEANHSSRDAGHPFSAVSRMKPEHNPENDPQLSLPSTIRYIVQIALRPSRIFSYNDQGERNDEVSEMYEELREQQEENEKMLVEMQNGDEDTEEFEQIVSLNNELMKSIAGELHDSGVHSEGAQENPNKSENEELWLKLARDEVSLSKHLSHLRKTLYSH